MMSEKENPKPVERSVFDMSSGESAVVKSLGKGRGFRVKMLGLGIRPGVRITLTGGSGKGPRIIKIENSSNVMIGMEIVSHIIIQEENDE